jgi:outer membrane protein OmpA-like peptidoglycan-associated protein
MTQSILAYLGLSTALATFGCTQSLVVKDPQPVVVSAKPPAEPEAPQPPRVVVKRGRILIKETINFEADRSVIRNDSFALLDEIVLVINAHTELVKIRIEGHTDSTGDPKANLALSKHRASVVRAYLVEHGVDARRLIAEGFGAENPIASNDDDDGRAQNRRVVFTVLDRADTEDGGAL